MADDTRSTDWFEPTDDTSETTDPVARATGTERDLYGISTWEERTAVDRLSATVYETLCSNVQATIAALVLLITVGTMLGILLPFLLISDLRPFLLPVLYLTGLSIVPALLIVGFIWFSDGTLREPIVPLLVTFVLGALLAGLAAMTNGVFVFLNLLGIVGVFLLYYLIVAPVEELVKLAAVRVFAYRTANFSAVVDGAIYGAVAGLGFATIENFTYIGNFALLIGPDTITLIRSFSGPGHVIWSAIAGYYLGLAKYNPEHAGPIIVKGLLIAAFFHATHNFAAVFIAPLGLGVWWTFQLSWHGIALAYLCMLIWRYRNAYLQTYSEEPAPLEPKTELADTVDIDRQLERLTSLHEHGVFTDEEFEQKHRKIRGQL
ncbi:PrsW family glutamic-type intramembrane protease [Natronorubrum sp. DTA28]|uniref:PrsW family glutamic-type intramembrane protease n=1 Tax=Natronorubrum sp. DTA28 TaxID=3447019 RepID=UPI003F86E257